MYWSNWLTSGTSKRRMTPLEIAPVSTILVDVPLKSVDQSVSPADACTLVTGTGLDSVNRIAPSAPLLGLCSLMESVPGCGPVGLFEHAIITTVAAAAADRSPEKMRVMGGLLPRPSFAVPGPTTA